MPGMKKGDNKETSMTGKAGEFMVAAQLLQRGLHISFPAVDNGVDILAENGCRIQVKTARLRSSASLMKMFNEPVYSFHFPKTKTYPHRVTRVNRRLSEYCDVVVLVGIEQNRFWVVPATVLDDTHGVYMGPTKKSGTMVEKIFGLEGAWDNILSFQGGVVVTSLIRFPEFSQVEVTRAE